MRILFASNHTYPPQRVGGVESSTHDLCVELSARGHDVAVLARLAPYDPLWLANRIRRILPPQRLFPADRPLGYPAYRGWTPSKGVNEVVDDFGPDAIVVQGGEPVPLAQASLNLDIPTVLYLRDVEFHLLGGRPPRDPRLLVLANSAFTARRTREKLDVEAQVLPPLVRPEAYRTATTREVVLFVNPHPWKGVDIALRLAENRSDVPFVFLEAWKLRKDRRREYVPRAAALPNVEWHAPVRDMRAMYARAKVVLVPSVWEEAWGRIATEAQVSGIPVLASDRGGLPESVGPGGVLVHPDAPSDAWLAALSRLWDDREEYERLCQAALAHSRRSELQPAAIVTRFTDLVGAHVER